MNIAFGEMRENEPMMQKTKTVILWGREDTLGKGVGIFLNARKGWEVIRITEEQDARFLLQEVERVNPNVVIIYQGDYASETGVPAQLVTSHPGLKVITVSLENNSIEVYNKQKILVKDVSDLLSVVES